MSKGRFSAGVLCVALCLVRAACGRPAEEQGEPVAADESREWLSRRLCLAAEPAPGDRLRLLRLELARAGQIPDVPPAWEPTSRPPEEEVPLSDSWVALAGALPGANDPGALRDGIDVGEILKGRGAGVHGSVFFGVDSKGGWNTGLSVGTDLVPGRVHLEIRTEVGRSPGYPSPWGD